MTTPTHDDGGAANLEQMAWELAAGRCSQPGGDRLLAKAILSALRLVERETLERAAKVAEAESERVKHTSHRDGLGMGSLCCEAELGNCAMEIRALKEERKP